MIYRHGNADDGGSFGAWIPDYNYYEPQFDLAELTNSRQEESSIGELSREDFIPHPLVAEDEQSTMSTSIVQPVQLPLEDLELKTIDGSSDARARADILLVEETTEIEDAGFAWNDISLHSDSKDTVADQQAIWFESTDVTAAVSSISG